LEYALALEELALRCRQRGGMHCLDSFLAAQSARGRIPVLITHSSDGENFDWATLVYELTLLGLRTGIYLTDEISGHRTVIAPQETRASAASKTAAALLTEGAHAILITCLSQSTDADFTLQPQVCSCRWAIRRRKVARTLKVRDGSYEATLKSLGKATRFNMGYYRRKLAREISTKFVSDARGMLSISEIDLLNKASLNPVAPELARLQYAQACTARGGFLVGLRDDDGSWLGLVGGWRQAETTVLLWQMNRAGLERNSMGIVMRGYFLEHEIAKGAQEVTFHGGSPNSIEHSFIQENVTDLMAFRNSWQSKFLAALASFFGRSHWWKNVPSFTAMSFGDPKLNWHQEAAGSDGYSMHQGA
jgi:hypothetical protein